HTRTALSSRDRHSVPTRRSSDLLLPSEEDLEGRVFQRLDLESILETIPGYLTPRERDILCDRYGLCGRPEQSRTEIRKKYHCSRQYVSAVERRAIRKLRERLADDDEN